MGENEMDIRAFWNDILKQDRDALPGYFHPNAVIRWHCTNEQFSVAEYVRANCEYPGKWDGEMERIEEIGGTTILAGRVFSEEEGVSFHVVSFIKLTDGKISEMDEIGRAHV